MVSISGRSLVLWSELFALGVKRLGSHTKHVKKQAHYITQLAHGVPVEHRTRTDPQGRDSGSPFRSQQTGRRTTRCSSQ